MLPWLQSPSLRPTFLLASPLILVLLAITLNFAHLHKYSTYSKSSTNCNSLLKHGRYIDDSDPNPRAWQPDGCSLRDYASDPSDLFNYCFNPGDELVFTGDSTSRQVFWGVSNIFKRSSLTNYRQQKDLVITHNNVTLSFYWNPKLKINRLFTTINYTKNAAPEDTKKYLFISAGLWLGLGSKNETKHMIVPNYNRLLSILFNAIDTRVPGSLEATYFAPIFIPAFPFMRGVRRNQISPEFCRSMINCTDYLFSYERTGHGGGPGYHGGVRTFVNNTEAEEYHQTDISSYYVPVFNELYSEHHYASREISGMHFVEPGFLTEANILLNHMCNERIAKAYREQNKIFPQGTCCVPAPPEHGSLVFVGLVLAVLLYLALGFRRPWLGILTGTIVAAAYVALINRSPAVSLVTPTFRFGDTLILFQVWVVLTWATLGTATTPPTKFLPRLAAVDDDYDNNGEENDTGYDQDEENWFTLLRTELKGITSSLLVVIALSGWDRSTGHVMGEIWSRILLSIWACADIMSFMSQYARSDNKLIFLLLQFSRLILLPVVVEAAGGTFGRVTDEWLFNLSVSSHWSLPVRMAFWYLFAAIFSPVSAWISDHVISWIGMQETAFWRRVSKFYLTALFAGLMYIGFQLSANKWQPLRILIFDYWVMVAAVAVGPSWHAPVADRRFTIGSIVAAIVAANTAIMSFGSFFPQTYGTIEPMVQAEIFQSAIDAAIYARTVTYNAFWHFVVTVGLLWSYIVIRRKFMDCRLVSSKSTNNHIPLGSTLPTVSRAWTLLGPSSYELLTLRPHIILAHGGSLLVHLLPTGVIISSSVKHTMTGVMERFYPQGLDYDYGSFLGAGKAYGYGFIYNISWNVIFETLRRACSLGLVLWAAWTIAWVSSDGWNKEEMNQQALDDDVESSGNGLMEYELVDKCSHKENHRDCEDSDSVVSHSDNKPEHNSSNERESSEIHSLSDVEDRHTDLDNPYDTAESIYPQTQNQNSLPL